jgi:hypothetical protein
MPIVRPLENISNAGTQALTRIKKTRSKSTTRQLLLRIPQKSLSPPMDLSTTLGVTRILIWNLTGHPLDPQATKPALKLISKIKKIKTLGESPPITPPQPCTQRCSQPNRNQLEQLTQAGIHGTRDVGAPSDLHGGSLCTPLSEKS